MLDSFNHIIDSISNLPGIGKKSAMRIAFHILQKSPEDVRNFTQSISDFHQNIKFCHTCGALSEDIDICVFCLSPQRDSSIICVVEQPSDIFYIEDTGDYNGLYHVLMGVLDPIEGIEPEDLRLQALLERIQVNYQNPIQQVQEIIIATNPSIQGDATGFYILDMLQHYKDIVISRIATGITMGSQIDFADSHVIAHSIKGRIPIK